MVATTFRAVEDGAKNALDKLRDLQASLMDAIAKLDQRAVSKIKSQVAAVGSTVRNLQFDLTKIQVDDKINIESDKRRAQSLLNKAANGVSQLSK